MNREAWLTAVSDNAFETLFPSYPVPKIRISVGYAPRQRPGSKVLAVCCPRSASADQTNEIFVTPEHNDSIKIAATLVHELAHAIDDCAHGHGAQFAAIVNGLFSHPLTHYHPTPALLDWANNITQIYGEIPHAALDLTTARKKQTTRMHKWHCPACDWTARLSRKHASALASHDCPACGNTQTTIGE